MPNTKKIKKENLKRLCWERGLSVSALAQRLSVHRVTIYAAVRNPERYGPTWRKIEEVLCA